MKKIKPNISNLIKALRASAKAHKAEFCDWSEGDYQVAIHSDSVPVVLDFRGIVSAFAKNANSCTSIELGYCVVFLDEVYYNEEVDEESLMFALPYGLEIDWEIE